MNIEIPLSAIECEAAMTAVVSLRRYIRDLAANHKQITGKTKNEAKALLIEDIKESFFAELYKKLLAREFEEITLPRNTTSTPYSQFLEMALDSTSRIILEIYKKSLRVYSGAQNPGDYIVFADGAKKIRADEIIKYFYVDYLTSVYMYIRAVKLDRKIPSVEDLKKIEFRSNYFNALDKYCQDSIRTALRKWKFDPQKLKSDNEQDVLSEIRRLVKMLKKEPFVKRGKQRHRPLTRYIICGHGLGEEELSSLPKDGISGRVVRLDAAGKHGNIQLRENQLEEAFGKKLSDESKDLLGIAGYIYVGDNLISRGPRWRRSIRFFIPVRKYRFWKGMAEHLSYTLSFLSGDSISVEFYKYMQEDEGSPDVIPEKKKINADCVCLLSGGIDTFAGTLKLIKDNKKPFIISHFAQSQIAHVQKELGDFFGEYVDKEKGGPLVHLILKIGKKIWEGDASKQSNQENREKQNVQVEEPRYNHQRQDLELSSHNIENSQRMRSFLYFSLGSIAAAELDLWEFRITENGISSFNLPITPAYLSTRCGRPTHPRNLHNFGRIVNALYKKNILIRNPYVFKTKAEVIKNAVETQQEKKMLRKTATCSKYSIGVIFDRRRGERHCRNCGACYECILRIGSILGANIDPEFHQYIVNPFKDLEKMTDLEQETLIRFMNYCWEVRRKSSLELIYEFPDLCLPREYFADNNKIDVCEEAVFLHKRFAVTFLKLLDKIGADKLRTMTGLYMAKPSPAVDVHCHVDQYPDPFYVLARAKCENLKIVSVGMNFRTSLLNLQLSRYFDSIIPAAGLHPLEVPNFVGGHFLRFAKLFDKTDFIGEIGLDYYFEKNKENYPRQREILWDILSYCRGKSKIFNVHSKGAEKDVLDLLGKQDAEKVIMHWYSGPISLIPLIRERGYYISVNKSVFSSKKIRSYIEMLPRERILTESDGPGDRLIHKNSPFFVRSVASEIAKVWRVSEAEAQIQLNENFSRLLGTQG